MSSKHKAWLRYGWHVAFGPKDRTLCHVVPESGSPIPLHLGGYVEADTADGLRAALHAKIDEHFKLVEHLGRIDAATVERVSNERECENALDSLDSLDIFDPGAATIVGGDLLDLIESSEDIGNSK